MAKALAADVAQRLRPILRAQREQTHDFESYLNGAFRAYFQFLIDELRDWGPGRPRAERYPYIRIHTPGQGAVFEEIQSSLNLVIEHGLVPPVDTQFLTAAMIGVAQNVGETMLAREPLEVEAAAAFAVNLILHGLSAMPRPRSA